MTNTVIQSNNLNSLFVPVQAGTPAIKSITKSLEYGYPTSDNGGKHGEWRVVLHAENTKKSMDVFRTPSESLARQFFDAITLEPYIWSMPSK